MCPTGTTLRPINLLNDDATSDFRQAFKVIDVDHDGKISGDDLRSFYASVSGAGNQGEDDMIKAMIALADANKDGYVQYEEFEKVLKEKKRFSYGGGGGGGAMMEEMFKVMDKDGDGKLGVDDLKSYLKLAGIIVDDYDIMAMIKLGCTDRGGDSDSDSDSVSFDGFVNIFSLL